MILFEEFLSIINELFGFFAWDHFDAALFEEVSRHWKGLWLQVFEYRFAANVFVAVAQAGHSRIVNLFYFGVEVSLQIDPFVEQIEDPFDKTSLAFRVLFRFLTSGTILSLAARRW